METQLAYLAGIVDGEGCLFFHKRSRKGAIYLTPRIQVVNTYEPLIDWLQAEYGGSKYTVRRASPKVNHKTIYHWHLVGGPAVELVRLFRPYLRIKHQQADVLIAAWDGRSATPHNLRRMPLKPEVIAQRMEWDMALRALNRKGAS